MPELDIVEYSRRLLYEHIFGHTVDSVQVMEDPIIFKGNKFDIPKELSGRTILDVRRYGKYFWIVFDGDFYLLMHFGMTGYMQIRGEEHIRYKTGATNSDDALGKTLWPPRFWKIEIKTKEGVEFALGDPRRLGRIRLCNHDPIISKELGKVGFDPILNMPSPNDILFISKVKNRSVPLKSLLLDQSFVAGIGNWMADDSLLHARLHPLRLSSSLSEEEIARLHSGIKFVSEKVVEYNSNSNLYPKEWLYNYRWPQARRKAKDPVLINGHGIEFITVAGRTTAYVPDLQKIYQPSSNDSSGKPITTKRPRSAKRVKKLN